MIRFLRYQSSSWCTSRGVSTVLCKEQVLYWIDGSDKESISCFCSFVHQSGGKCVDLDKINVAKKQKTWNNFIIHIDE